MFKAPGHTLGLLVLLASAVGCTFSGPSALEDGRLDYNEAVQRTESEQLLLNIVRLHYRDTPLFMQVASVAATYEARGNAGVSASVPYTDTRAGLSFSPSLSGSYLERPTISLVPLQGEDFSTKLLTRLKRETISLVSRSGWRIDRVLRLCLQHFNGLPNAPTASGPTPSQAPEFQEFLRAIDGLRTMQARGWLTSAVEVRKQGADDETSEPGLEGERDIVISVAKEAEGSPELARLRALVRSDERTEQEQLKEPQQLLFPLRRAATRGPPGVLTFETRSLIGVMFYLSQGVEVPEEDQEVGRVTTTRTASGQPFQWQELLGGLWRVTNEPPENGAFLSVSYRGETFYIDDTDLDTKSTFMFLTQLFDLQAVTIEGSPLISLAVGGG